MSKIDEHESIELLNGLYVDGKNAERTRILALIDDRINFLKGEFGRAKWSKNTRAEELEHLKKLIEK